MIELLVQLAPIFFYFAVGLGLKYFGLADKSHGDFLIRLVFFVTLPLLIITTIPNTVLNPEKVMLPLSNILVGLLCCGTMILLLKATGLSRQTQGTMVLGGMTINNTYMFPFILTVYGNSGFADAILFDFGNALMVSSFTYALAFRFGEKDYSHREMLLRILRSPLFWSLLLATVLAMTGNSLPFALQDTIRPLANMTSPLILIALGIYFSLQLHHLKLVSVIILMRMVLGLVFGLLVATVLGLEGESFTVVVLCSAAPIGFSVLALSAMARLDIELASSAVSLSVLIGLLWVPLLIRMIG